MTGGRGYGKTEEAMAEDEEEDQPKKKAKATTPRTQLVKSEAVSTQCSPPTRSSSCGKEFFDGHFLIFYWLIALLIDFVSCQSIFKVNIVFS